MVAGWAQGGSSTAGVCGFNLRRVWGVGSTLVDKVMTRPIGVTMSAVLLGMMGVAQIVSAWSLLVEVNKPSGGGWFPGLVALFIHLLIFVLLAMAGWGLTTAVGLFRMLNWAPYSMMTIGVCMMGFGLPYGLWMFSNWSKQRFHGPALPCAVMGAASAGLGLVWVVYFGQGTTVKRFTAEYRSEFPEEPGFAASTLNLTGTPAAPPKEEAPPQ
jgi:hypothetical protein